MDGRATTNILLAIIAGVLLFGSAATMGALKWVLIGCVALFALWAVFAFVAYLIRETVKALSDAKTKGRDVYILTIFGLSVLGFLPVYAGYIGLLWLQGDPQPAETATYSSIGYIWLSIFIIGGLTFVISALFTHRNKIIPGLRYGLSLLIRSPLAPLFMSAYGWRKARTAGDGVVSSIASAFVGLFLGGLLWLFFMFFPLMALSKKLGVNF